MTSRTVDIVDQEIEAIGKEIEDCRKAIRDKKKERRSLLREERDQLRYITGGLIFDHLEELNGVFPNIIIELYKLASTRDKVKFVRAGFVEDDLEKLRSENIGECKESVRTLPREEQLNDLSEKDKEHLEKITAAFSESDSKLKRKIYGRKDEIKVFVGRDEELFISNKLAAFLRDHEEFSY